MEYDPIITHQRIRKLRQMNRLTQEKLAEKMHVSRQVIGYYETSRTPTTAHLYILAKELGTTTDYLLGLTETPTIVSAAESKFEKGVFDAAIWRHGALSQTDMMIEEMSELTKAILKNRRRASAETVDAILEEMADVEIMLDQMKMIFGSCAVHRRLKVRRLANRLGLSQMLTNDTKGEVES